MTQIVEDLNYVPGATYTLSWKGGTPQQLTAPATGHWTLPNIPIAAVEVQLEQGTVSTPFERRSYGAELALCQRYFCKTFDQGVAPAQAGSISGCLSVGGLAGYTQSLCAVNWSYPVTM
jgi:hypothetical protein